MVEGPVRLRVRMYQVGFGDCFLLTFEYDGLLPDGRQERHILIDFGTTRRPRGWRSLKTVAEAIRSHTNGEIDVVVVTHRHKDHLSAFGSKDTQTLMATGYPRLVVRSWTEDPDAAPEATGTPAAPAGGGNGSVGVASTRLLASLRFAEAFADELRDTVAAAPAGSLGAEVRQLADDQLTNREAVEQLARWAEAGRGEYLHYGKRSSIWRVVPGIKVRVLGPPTVDQHKIVATQREADPDEFWMLYQGIVKGLRPEDLLGRVLRTGAAAVGEADEEMDMEAMKQPDPAETEAPMPARPVGPLGPVRWLTDRMGRQQLNSLLRIVRILDDVLNNTSVILLFEVPAAGRTLRLLFGGDAQIENWEYALKIASNRVTNLKKLREVDLYKVGHHGSRNATPRTLFNLWTEPDTQEREMVALMSTKPGVHGKSPETAVPRKTLVAALDTRMRLFSTEKLTAKNPFVELVADLTAGGEFVDVPAPPG